MANTRRIEVNALSRVEGEGAIRVTVKDNTVEHVELNIYEPPRFFEAFCGAGTCDEVPDITCPHLRHLPGGLPDELVPRPGEGPRRHHPARDSRLSGDCSIAANGSKATPCTSTCSTPPISWATRAGISMAVDRRADVGRGLRMKKIGNRCWHPGRASDSSDQRDSRRILPVSVA